MNRKTVKIPRFQIPKLPWRGVLAGCFLLFFLAGILTANWVGREKLIQYGMLNDYYVGQLAYTELDTGPYFSYLLKQRLRIFGLSALLVYTRFGIWMLFGVVGWHAFILGYLFVNALVSMGLSGMLLVLVSVFPQILCYAAAYYGLAKILFVKGIGNVMPMGERSWADPKLLLLVSALLCMLVGVWLEGYVNPGILKYFIRRM